MRQECNLLPNDATPARVENAHQAMVDPEQWDTVRCYLDERKSGNVGPRSVKSPNPLSGRTECGLCRARLHTQ